jgi:hypothetical protein
MCQPAARRPIRYVAPVATIDTGRITTGSMDAETGMAAGAAITLTTLLKRPKPPDDGCRLSHGLSQGHATQQRYINTTLSIILIMICISGGPFMLANPVAVRRARLS